MKQPINRSQVPVVNVARARWMQRNPTPSEARLWSALRARGVGARFRRQVPSGSFIVDFLAPAERLVVEVDGSWHRHRRSADAAREQKLRRAGYRVLRVTADQVLGDLPCVLDRIRAATCPRDTRL